jgi:hypothetical protein
MQYEGQESNARSTTNAIWHVRASGAYRPAAQPSCEPRPSWLFTLMTEKQACNDHADDSIVLVASVARLGFSFG